MSLVSNLSWVKDVVKPEEIHGKRILDIGSKNWDETILSYVQDNRPSKHIGIDILPGNEVDIVMDVCEIVERFGENSFDLVFSLESLEHIQNWPLAISNMKKVVRPGGSVVLTTRSLGYPEHGFPDDYWRFQDYDLYQMFSDFQISSLVNDVSNFGVYIKATKPKLPIDLMTLEIHSMKKNARIRYQT